MLVAIGSTNPVKIAATKKAFQDRFGGEIIFQSIAVPSGVSDQPFGDDTRAGAIARARAAQRELQADYGVGCEGGIEIVGGVWYATAWCAVADKKGQVYAAHSLGVPMPQVLRMKIEHEGKELGVAQDEALGTTNAKHKEGFFGFATDNLVTREHGYTDALYAALAPIVKQEIYSTKS
jgi:inosine/xanthosine triphosphatase